MFTRLLPVFGDKKLDGITTADAEKFRDSLLDDDVSRATANRYRDLLSGMFRRAIRLCHVASNPVTPLQKLKESGGRIAYLTAEQERATFEALPVELRPLFVACVNTGCRWSEPGYVGGMCICSQGSSRCRGRRMGIRAAYR